MTEEHYKELSPIIKGISKRCAYKVFTRAQEDIEQDLWVKVLEREATYGHELEPNLIARICYDYIYDMIDYDQRRNHYNYEEDEVDDLFGSSKEDNPLEIILIKDLFDTFPEESLENLFLQFWGEFAGIKEPRLNIPKTRTQDGYTESTLANLLGYAGTADSRYKKFRSKMREFIRTYFDIEKHKEI